MKCLYCENDFVVNYKQEYVCRNDECKYASSTKLRPTVRINENVIDLFDLPIKNKNYELVYEDLEIRVFQKTWLGLLAVINYNVQLTIDNFDIEMKILIDRIDKLLLLV